MTSSIHDPIETCAELVARNDQLPLHDYEADSRERMEAMIRELYAIPGIKVFSLNQLLDELEAGTISFDD